MNEENEMSLVDVLAAIGSAVLVLFLLFVVAFSVNVGLTVLEIRDKVKILDNKVFVLSNYLIQAPLCEALRRINGTRT